MASAAEIPAGQAGNGAEDGDSMSPILKQLNGSGTTADGSAGGLTHPLGVEYCAAWRPPTKDGESADRVAAVRCFLGGKERPEMRGPTGIIGIIVTIVVIFLILRFLGLI